MPVGLAVLFNFKLTFTFEGINNAEKLFFYYFGAFLCINGVFASFISAHSLFRTWKQRILYSYRFCSDIPDLVFLIFVTLLLGLFYFGSAYLMVVTEFGFAMAIVGLIEIAILPIVLLIIYLIHKLKKRRG